MAEKTLEDESYCLHAVGVGRTGAGYVDGLLRTGEIEDVLEDPRATFAALVISVGHDIRRFIIRPTRSCRGLRYCFS
jgi:hypothetical protein